MAADLAKCQGAGHPQHVAPVRADAVQAHGVPGDVLQRPVVRRGVGASQAGVGDDRRIRSRHRTIGEYFTAERPLLGSLPDEPFETGRLFTLRVDRYSQICVRTNRYSVPVRLIGRTVRAMLHASELVVHDGREEVARHERLIAKGGCRLDLDHYLEALVRKPGALPGATALDQARSAGRFTPLQ
ncbi:hypothetical protein OG753_01615 [Streptomyces sp. NBC_00029]|uniref:Mu transposase domain-containing protein n=1 Tax=Streptomyces sp. NBC_00029 TaxID=2903613 RepID=UPI0032491753